MGTFGGYIIWKNRVGTVCDMVRWWYGDGTVCGVARYVIWYVGGMV